MKKIYHENNDQKFTMDFEFSISDVVKDQKSVVITGPASSGKTVFLSQLIKEIKEQNKTVTIFDVSAGISQYFPEAIKKDFFKNYPNGENISKDEILNCKTDFVVVDGVGDLSLCDVVEQRKGVIFTTQEYENENFKGKAKLFDYVIDLINYRNQKEKIEHKREI